MATGTVTTTNQGKVTRQYRPE